MVDQGFLNANPEIREMLNNDYSLINICDVNSVRSWSTLNYGVPQLYNQQDIAYNTNDFSIENYLKFLLCMVVNNRLNYTLSYYNISCTKNDIQNIMDAMKEAFSIVKGKFIEYFSGILGIEINSRMTLQGNRVIECHFDVRLEEHYRGGLADTHTFLMLCGLVKNELIRNGKIHNRMSQTQIARVIYNWVCLHCNYDLQFRKQSFSGYSCMVNGISVCQGFTATFNALCKLFGISVVGMCGLGKGRNSYNSEDHIWSYAILDGQYQYIDCTWGKPKFDNENKLRQYGVEPYLLCDFSYFCVPYNKFIQEHSWDRRLYG